MPSAWSASPSSASRLRLVVRPGATASTAALGAGRWKLPHVEVKMTYSAPARFACAT